MSLAAERADFVEALKIVAKGSLTASMLDNGVKFCTVCNGTIECPEEQILKMPAAWLNHKAWCPFEVARLVLVKHGIQS